MCTVSFYKSKDTVIITSNRDENINRPIATAPNKIVLDNSTVYCPLDTQHNGTWFAVKQNKSVCVLLNGAAKKHIPNPPYKKSRGLVLLEIVDSNNCIEKWHSIDLIGIENFTIVIYNLDKLTLLRWDGKTKSQLNLDEKKPHIWSSATLYDESTTKKREEWFKNFIVRKNNALNNIDFINFHLNTENNDQNNGLIINRENKILTKNVTQAILHNTHFTLHHWDLLKNEKTTLEEPYQ